MNYSYLESDKKYIGELQDFASSSNSILLLVGQDNYNKLKIADLYFKTLNNTFIFKHSCFEYSTINDMLLTLYDKIREWVKANNIQFKKSNKDNFQEKIFDYLEKLNHQVIIFVDNFSKLQDEKKVLDFLFYLSALKNIKIIINTENTINFPYGYSAKIIDFNQDANAFEKQLLALSDDILEDEILLFKEAVFNKKSYISVYSIVLSVLKTSISSLIEESRKKKADFREFLVNKAVASSIANYLNEAKTLAVLMHFVPFEFISKYNIASLEAINYLYKRNFLEKINDEYKLADVFVEYFLLKMSVKEKVDIYSNLIDIYENEISLSPNIRTLRLSRETMRQIIPHYKALIPVYDPKKIAIPNDFTYLGLNMQSVSNVFAPQKEAVVEEPKKIVLDEAIALISKYEYQKALNVLLFALNIEKNEQDKKSYLDLVSICYEKLGDIQNAISTQEKIAKFYKSENYQKYIETVFKIASLKKSIFDYNGALANYSLVLDDNFADNEQKIQAKFEELELTISRKNIDDAISNYLEFLKKLSDNNDKKHFSKCYFKIASLYEKQENYKDALLYYELSCKNKNEKDNFAGYSYLALSDIFEIQGDFVKHSENLENAITCFKEAKNFEELFEIYFRLGEKFKYSNSQRAVKHFMDAMDNAKAIPDNFKFAMAIVEIGDVFYNLNENTEALTSYFEAKKILKEDKRNLPKILSRIEDMKKKMNKDDFEVIAIRYE